MKKILIYDVRLVSSKGIIDKSFVEITGEKISRVGIPSDITVYFSDDYKNIIDGKKMYLSSGFIDIHLHGGGGSDFMDASEEAFENVLKAHLAHGTTSLVPTTLTAEIDELKKVFKAEKTVKKSMKSLDKYNCLPEILGVHMEGPYIAQSMAGAQDPKYIRTPNDRSWKQIIKASGGELLIWTVAPELAGADELCRSLKDSGIKFSIGHSDARYSDIVRAVESGYTMATHLYSGMSTIVRENGYRILGAVESSLLFDEITVEVIADGKHLPPELLKLIYKTKGFEKMILVTDAMRGASMPDGEYLLGSLKKGQPVSVFDGIAHMPDGVSFAGSVATADKLVRVMVKEVGIPLNEAVAMITENPAKAVGVDDRKGFVKEGFDADLVLFDDNINIQQVYIKGNHIK